MTTIITKKTKKTISSNIHNPNIKKNDKHDTYDEVFKLFPKIDDKLKHKFGIPQNIINNIYFKMHELYSKTTPSNPILSKHIHSILINTFINEYYPIASRNIRADNYTSAIIMGGISYNMNVPNKMTNFLNLETDDIDLKVYTTDINYVNRNPVNVARVLSVFKFISIIICLFMKQAFAEIIEFSRIAFEKDDYIPYIPRIKSKTLIKSTINNTIPMQNGSGIETSPFHLIKKKHRRFGILKTGKLKLILKNKRGGEDTHIDITHLSFEDTYKLLMDSVNDPDILITTKVVYNIKYVKPYNVYYSNDSRYNLTFSDSMIIYPSLENVGFYSYYFMTHTKSIESSLDTLIKQNITISNIINTKLCSSNSNIITSSSSINCRYISVAALQVDVIYMLKFAELLSDEDILAGNIIVPVACLYKYYKYMIKFIHLHIIKKYFNGTLKTQPNFIKSAKQLLKYVETELHKQTSQDGEALPINILYKSIINNFHQAFFIKKTMFPEYNSLREIVTDYDTTVYFIKRSMALFKPLDDKQGNVGSTIESISIQLADKELSRNSTQTTSQIISQLTNTSNTIDIKDVKDVNGVNDSIATGGSPKPSNVRKSRVILHSNYLFEDSDLDNKLYNKPKSIKKSSEESKTKPLSQKDIILDKLDKLVKTEIIFLNKLSNII